jgi:hypothetical protein
MEFSDGREGTHRFNFNAQSYIEAAVECEVTNFPWQEIPVTHKMLACTADEYFSMRTIVRALFFADCAV